MIEVVLMKINANEINVELLFKNYKRTVHLFIDRRLRSCTVVPRYTSLIRSRSLDLYQTGRIPNQFFPQEIKGK
jgi:hypothetical protein